MKRLLFIGLVFSANLLFAQKPCGFKDGLQEGLCKQFYDNGNTKEACHWKKGKLDGQAIFYYENGTKSAEGYFKKGCKVKTWTYYSKDGKISGKENFVYRDYMSVLEGEYITYHPNGNVDTKTNYKDGKINGDYYSYYENGAIQNKAKLHNNVTNSFEIFYPNGNVSSKGATDADFKRTGEWTYYRNDGTIEKIVTFKNGNKISEKKYKK